MTMVRAAITERPGLISLGEFPMPDPMPGAVIMKVHCSGICGTDKHTFRGESKQYAGTPHGRDLTYPLICGHENAGEVVATGAEVHDSDGRAGLTMSVETTDTAERIARAREHTGGIGPDISCSTAADFPRPSSRPSGWCGSGAWW
jgi:D-arabinose 1-dehydrogenase-like Zn-dependent alcohol dehydrogenase